MSCFARNGYVKIGAFQFGKTTAVDEDTTKRCMDCKQWCGRCRKGHRNKIAVSEACATDFEPKPKPGANPK